MKKIGTSIFTLFFVLSAFANGPAVIKGNLEWSAERAYVPVEGAKTYYISHFRDAFYDEVQPTLPIFTERFLLSAYSEIDATLANPVYDPNRCSIAVHPLHDPLMFPLYVLALCFPRTRLIGAGLVIHMSLDSLDCVVMGQWF